MAFDGKTGPLGLNGTGLSNPAFDDPRWLTKSGVCMALDIWLSLLCRRDDSRSRKSV